MTQRSIAIEPFLTVSEASSVARLNELRIRQLLREGTIKGIRPGGRGSWRIRLSELERYLCVPGKRV